MKQNNIFLNAEWNNLLMLNFAVEASLLERFVPAGTELDAFEGRTYLSLVGFEFNRLRRSSKRGVVFIREFVPKYAVAVVARFAFNENYSCVPMPHRIETRADGAVEKAECAWLGLRGPAGRRLLRIRSPTLAMARVEAIARSAPGGCVRGPACPRPTLSSSPADRPRRRT